MSIDGSHYPFANSESAIPSSANRTEVTVVKVKFKMRKGSGMYISIIAGIAFILMAVTRFGFPVEKIIEFLWICFVMLVVLILLAAPVALLIRWWSNRHDS